MCEFFEIIIHQFFYYTHYYENSENPLFSQRCSVLRAQNEVRDGRLCLSRARGYRLREGIGSESVQVDDPRESLFADSRVERVEIHLSHDSRYRGSGD